MIDVFLLHHCSGRRNIVCSFLIRIAEQFLSLLHTFDSLPMVVQGRLCLIMVMREVVVMAGTTLIRPVGSTLLLVVLSMNGTVR